MSENYSIDNAKKDIENLQDQNSYDFQEIKRLDGLIKDYDKRVLQAINFNNQINKKIQDDYENFKKTIMDDNLDIGNGGASGEGLTSTQKQQLQIAYGHSQSEHVQVDDIPTKVSELKNDSSYVTTSEMKTAISNISASGGASGEGLTSTQKQQLQIAYDHSQSEHVQVDDIPTKVSELKNDSSYVTTSEMKTAISNISASGGVDLSGYYTKAEIDAYRPLVKTIADNVWTLKTLVEDGTEIYTNILTHNLATTDICVSFFDSNLENLYCAYKCIDENNIEITNDEAVTMTVVIFHGGINTSVSSSNAGTGTSYTNQTWLFIGDSITAGIGTTKTYAQYLKEKLSLGSVINLGVNGKKLSPTMANDIKTVTTSTNAVFVFGGTNDFYGNVPLGEYYTTDESGVRTLNTDTSTYRGALISICQTMYSRFPTAMHILMTPIHRELYNGTQITDLQPNSNGVYLEEYVNSVKEVGRMMSVYVIDLYAESGLQPNVPENKAQFFGATDGLHPIAAGHEKIADCIINNL